MLQLGEVVHDYTVLDHKGSGSFGYVFSVQDNRLNETLALKLLTNNSGNNDARFRAENDHLHTLIAQGSIIDPKTRVLDVGGKTFYCMELADTSAEQHMPNNPLGNVDALKLFREVCEGMEYAHQHRIVHRDLHLGNVLLFIDNSGGLHPKLTDFGIAKDFNAASLGYIPATVWGMVNIWSPEVFFLIWDDAQIDKYILADIYALGMMLHSILASSPVPYTSGLVNSIATYLKRQGIVGNGGIQIDSSLDIAIRRREYSNWLSTYDRSNQANLEVTLREPNRLMQVKVNQIIQKCCSPDYNDRYMNVGELLVDVRSLC